ncbi:hypothetical protein DL766_006331 [Monosporascus sp. MC13-8B]|uniref:Uncharacterized protein n=1 Tax=Monosporascus cannonballus TaxID=155416 RepID=A0ABY0H1K6_9PEZI|nr:hypothetical protein DL762_006591 [Monosporascus cannonballus]RYO90172.1 hypothetical protein DL763_005413 [Monosporascus cannonballus]RYP27547.1 hypothetical protein DL766_006331 [Monosporascus sp. MC13-8B]
MSGGAPLIYLLLLCYLFIPPSPNSKTYPSHNPAEMAVDQKREAELLVIPEKDCPWKREIEVATEENDTCRDDASLQETIAKILATPPS